MSNSQTAQTSHKNTRGTLKIPPDFPRPIPLSLSSLCYKECYSVPSDFSYTAEAILMNNSLHGNKRQIIKLEDEGGGMWEREKVTEREREREKRGSFYGQLHIWWPCVALSANDGLPELSTISRGPEKASLHGPAEEGGGRAAATVRLWPSKSGHFHFHHQWLKTN